MKRVRGYVEKDLTNKMYDMALLLKSIPLPWCWRDVEGQRSATAATIYATWAGRPGRKAVGMMDCNWFNGPAE